MTRSCWPAPCVLAAHGLALSAHTMIDGTVSEDDLDTELTTFLARGLAP